MTIKHISTGFRGQVEFPRVIPNPWAHHRETAGPSA